MKTRTLPLLCALLCLASACTDSALKEQVDQLEQRVASLESQVKQLNSQFSQLNTVVQKLAAGCVVSSVKPTQDGYLITFTDNSSIEVKHGKKGEDGQTPAMGLRQDTDGNWYWTLNGDWLKDASGKQVRANGAAPQVKVESGYWWLSTDDGKTWTQLAPYYDAAATLITAVDPTSSQRYVYITLSDGSTLALPRQGTLKLVFDEAELVVFSAGETRSLGFTLEGGTEKNTVKALGQGGWIASVTMESATKGKVNVTAPDPIVECEVLVFANDGEGYTIIASIDLVKGTISFSEESASVSVSGGKVSLKVRTNVNYTPVPRADWVVYDPSTKALREDELTFLVQPNNGLERSCRIDLMIDGKAMAHAVITQDGGFSFEGFGIVKGETFVHKYDKAHEQLGVYSAEGKSWCRILDLQTLTTYEVGPVPDEPQPNQTFSGTFTTREKGTVKAEQPHSFTVVSHKQGVLQLVDETGTAYALRF
ncbi:MAG: hypothetical protein J6M31_06010 [Bacteroidales bacterium]|nr:hypothetical protein [Bacteroidales bacterium]